MFDESLSRIAASQLLSDIATSLLSLNRLLVGEGFLFYAGPENGGMTLPDVVEMLKRISLFTIGQTTKEYLEMLLKTAQPWRWN